MHTKGGARNTKRVVVAGARPDTGNHGCTALSICTVNGILTRVSDLRLTLLDLGVGMRNEQVDIDGQEYSYQSWGAVNTRKLFKKSAFWNMRGSALLKLRTNPGANAMMDANVVMDISSGDSFGDLYGPHRFYDDILPKLIAIENKKKLILLPQTYGPFRDPKNKKLATRIVKSSFHSWARDTHSFDILKSMLGDDFDEQFHHLGVDVAFLLPAREPVDLELVNWIKKRKVDGYEVLGLNISGLLYGRPEASKSGFDFRADYDLVVDRLIEYLLNDPSRNLVLVPHVEAGGLHDRDVCERVYSLLKATKYSDRINIVPKGLHATEVKYLISLFDWFCGTRMHSTIAGLSSCVPSVAIAYSLKTKGVFEACGQGDNVVDPRVSSSNELFNQIIDGFDNRYQSKAKLDQEIPQVKQTARKQMDLIADSLV